jgi:UDP-glucose 4-epimerase
MSRAAQRPARLALKRRREMDHALHAARVSRSSKDVEWEPRETIVIRTLDHALVGNAGAMVAIC